MRSLFPCFALAAALFSRGADARPEYPDFIPAAPVDGRCGTCHVDPMGGGDRNAFGSDVEASIDGDGPSWSKLFCIDSDGDGFTNGQELGDPCGTWTPGETPNRTEPLSAPADPDDAVDVDDGDSCDGQAPPTCTSAAAAGCAATQGSLTGLAGLLALAIRLRRRSCSCVPSRS